MGCCWAGVRRLVAVGIVGFVAATGGAQPAKAAAATPVRPADGAVMVGWHEDGDDVDDLRLHEAELGTRFALVRMYQQWQLPSRRVATMINDNRLVLVSHKPPATGWAAVASGAEDPMIQALAEAYRAFGREVLFTFHHEPHDDASDVKGGAYGTVAEYRAAWRRIRSIFDRVGASHSAGGKVFFAYSATGSWALKAAAGGPPGSGDPLYPGDDLVDVFAHDRYNWASCRGDAWEDFPSEWAPLVALAAAHHKPLIAAEFGSPPADGARNEWFRQTASWLRNDPVARRWMWGFAYYHTLHDTCPWDFLSHGDDGRLGWQDAFRDPYFTGVPFSLASANGSPPPLETATLPTIQPATGIVSQPKPANPPRVTTTTTVPATTTTNAQATATTAPGTTSSSVPVPESPSGASESAAPPGSQPTSGSQQGPGSSRSGTSALLAGLAFLLAGALVARHLIGA